MSGRNTSGRPEVRVLGGALNIREANMTGWRYEQCSFSNGNSFGESTGNNTAEIGHAGQAVAVRDSQDPGGPSWRSAPPRWRRRRSAGRARRLTI